MSFIPDDKLFSHSERVKGKVVVITGGANGIGKETVLRFAQYGAKVVIADLDTKNAEKLVAKIKSNGGTAIWCKCDTANWDDQTAMFELAMKEYGAVDIVVPNAGILESDAEGLKFDSDGKPLKPSLKTITVNLTGVLYTVHLALHYLYRNPTTTSSDPLKALIFIGSMASWLGLGGAPQYTGSKHAVLGIMRAISKEARSTPLRVGCIHPFFADTGIVPVRVKLMLAGIPLTKVEKIAGAIFYAATDPDESTNGSSWILADDGEVFMLPKEEFKLGVYAMMDQRINGIRTAISSVHAWYAFIRDVSSILAKPIITVGIASVAAKVAWDHRHLIEAFVGSLLQ